jgi:hypothetical protein
MQYIFFVDTLGNMQSVSLNQVQVDPQFFLSKVMSQNIYPQHLLSSLRVWKLPSNPAMSTKVSVNEHKAFHKLWMIKCKAEDIVSSSNSNTSGSFTM